jgi:hypothetical protein
LNSKIYSLLCAVFLFVQYTAIIHAIDHPFHTSTSECEVYFIAENLGNALVDLAINFNFCLFGCEILPFFIVEYSQLVILHFFARAPPIFL